MTLRVKKEGIEKLVMSKTNELVTSWRNLVASKMRMCFRIVFLFCFVLISFAVEDEPNARLRQLHMAGRPQVGPRAENIFEIFYLF